MWTFGMGLRAHWRHIIAAGLCFAFCLTAKVDTSGGDNALYGVTAQSILRDGSPNLDAERERYGAEKLHRGAYWTLLEWEGHWENYFPVGNALTLLPVVALANLLGWDMAHPEEARWVQRCASALFLIAMGAIFLRLARRLLPESWAWGVTLALVGGTSMASICGSGWWSHNGAALFIALSLVEMWSLNQRTAGPGAAWRLGGWLFMAYACRPSAAIFVALALGWLLWRDGRQFWKTAGILALLMALFMAWSRNYYGIWLPPYYLPKRMAESGDFWGAIQGNLWSPARGILIYAPLLGVALGAPLFRSLRKQSLVGLLFLAGLIHLILISRFEHWWAGWTYGPRLQTEMVPVWGLLGMLVLQKLLKWFRFRLFAWAMRGLALVGLTWSLTLHLGQGLYNPGILVWNGTIDRHPEHYLFNWDFPQFLVGLYPAELPGFNALFLEECKGQLKRNGEKVRYLLPMDRNPFAARLARLHRRKGTFGNAQVYVRAEHFLKDSARVAYANPAGRDLLKNHAEWNCELNPESPVLGDLIYHEDFPCTIIAGNHVARFPLSDSSLKHLTVLGSTFPDTWEAQGWIMIAENGELRQEMLYSDFQAAFYYPKGHVVKVGATGALEPPAMGIFIDGKEIGFRKMGFNVVQFNPDSGARRYFHFEPQYGDVESRSLCRVVLAEDQPAAH